jgi:ABC-type bacteriocin/lantibiotic exporter with double-glycine peptidase domain
MQNDVSKKNVPFVPRIEFRNVSLAYQDQVVLDRVSFSVAPGEINLMVGESGGGKSTISKLVLGLERADIKFNETLFDEGYKEG